MTEFIVSFRLHSNNNVVKYYINADDVDSAYLNAREQHTTMYGDDGHYIHTFCPSTMGVCA